MVMKKIGAVVASAMIAAALAPAAAFAANPSVDYAQDPNDSSNTNVAETGWDSTNNQPGTGGNVTTLTLQLQDPSANLASNGGTAWVAERAKVQVPVAINFVVDGSGNIIGPSSGANITNYSSYAVHVSNIKVTEAGGANIVPLLQATTADKVYLTMKPGSNGTAIDLSTFKGGTGAAPAAGTEEEWNISANGTANDGNVLTLTGFNGSKIGGFGSIDPTTKTTFGTIAWTIQAGSATNSQVTQTP